MVKLKDHLMTQRFNVVSHEDKEEQKFNAPHHFVVDTVDGKRVGYVNFQEGPMKENEPNGVFNEDLLAMVRVRLQGFQQSNYACRENAIAITKIEEALMWLKMRTRNRELQGILGTSKA